MDKAPEQDFHPRKTSTVFGHEAAEREFLAAFNGDRLHHAWLITGPKGVGKASLVWRIAKFLTLQDRATDAGPGLFGDELPSEAISLDVDPENPAIQRVIAGGHGNISVAERTVNEKTGKLRSDIVIDDVRKLISFFSQTSAEGGWRIAIVDAADEMNANSANALLKLLEEPPARSILFLVSHSPGRLLPTIRSRCRTVKLKTLGDESVQAVLAARYPDLPGEELRCLARLSGGAPGKAIELAERDGVALYRTLNQHLVGLPRLNIPQIHDFAAKLAAPKADAEYHLFVEMFLGWIERLVRQNASAEASPEVVDGESAAMARISTSAGLDHWLDLWEKMGRLVQRADAVNLDRKQVIVTMFTSVGSLVRS